MISRSTKIEVDWTIKNLDSGKLIRPQFPLTDGVNMSVGGNLIVQNRFGFQDPIVQWVQGKDKTITFQTKLFARNIDDDIISMLSDFEDLAVKDDALGRSPICLFSYGQFVSETVFVESVDPTFKDIINTAGQTVGAASGGPRDVSLTFTLRRYTAFSQQHIDPTKTPKESFYLIATAAEQSWEAIAKRFYGDPLLGDRLRKRHPEYPFSPPIGAKVKVPARSVILSEVVQPQSHIFDLEDAETVEAYEFILAERNARKVTMAS